jgi:hypothetical protein
MISSAIAHIVLTSRAGSIPIAPHEDGNEAAFARDDGCANRSLGGPNGAFAGAIGSMA